MSSQPEGPVSLTRTWWRRQSSQTRTPPALLQSGADDDVSTRLASQPLKYWKKRNRRSSIFSRARPRRVQIQTSNFESPLLR